MKLTDLRRQLKAGDIVAGRHPSGAAFVPTSEGLFWGIDPGAGPGEVTVTTFERMPDGSTRILAASRVHRLGAPDLTATIDDLSKEMVERRASSALPYELGPSFLARYRTISAGAREPWKDNSGILPWELAEVMAEYKDRRWPGGRFTRDVEHEDYLVYTDSRFRAPTLLRYVKTGVSEGVPVIFAKGAGRDLHMGRADAFYPAETVACAPCKGTGKVTEAFRGEARGRGEADEDGVCSLCYGLSRLWRARIFVHPEAETSTPTNFADANPKKWKFPSGALSR